MPCASNQQRGNHGLPRPCWVFGVGIATGSCNSIPHHKVGQAVRKIWKRLAMSSNIGHTGCSIEGSFYDCGVLQNGSLPSAVGQELSAGPMQGVALCNHWACLRSRFLPRLLHCAIDMMKIVTGAFAACLPAANRP
jgi:hypothetical protein